MQWLLTVGLHWDGREHNATANKKAGVKKMTTRKREKKAMIQTERRQLRRQRLEKWDRNSSTTPGKRKGRKKEGK